MKMENFVGDAMEQALFTLRRKMKKYDRHHQYSPSNREKSMVAKKNRFWCDGCDACKVGQWGKCPNCGWKHNSKKKKQK